MGSPIDGADRLFELAVVDTLAGETDAAVGRLERLLAVPSEFTPTLLHLNPTWALLRGNARFRRLVGESPRR